MTDPEGEATRYGYDAMMREVRRELPNGVVTERSYDGAGRTTAIKTEGSGPWGYGTTASEAYLYNAAGQRTYTVDSHGAVTAYAYDGAGRVAEVLYPFGGGKKEADFRERLSMGLWPEQASGSGNQGVSPRTLCRQKAEW